MVSTRSRAAAAPVAPSPSVPSPSAVLVSQPAASTPVQSPVVLPSSGDDAYERRRDERIRENLERLQKLGIVDLALKIKAERRRAPSKKPYSKSPPSCKKPALPARRSSRLQNVASVSYSESERGEKRRREPMTVVIEEGAREEVYTEAHDKLLGKYEAEWELFVDGYGADGRRVYNQVTGKTCHQCRQKTLGHRTSCSRCDLVQGQFCGDCLFMRYGENVLEANKNPNWVCPVCRGICNCSLCRVKKGWAPTGPLYKKVKSMGYQSVAHYLIQTRRADDESNLSGSAKRSLKFVEESNHSDKSSITGVDSDSADDEAVASDCSIFSSISSTIDENPTLLEMKLEARKVKRLATCS